MDPAAWSAFVRLCDSLIKSHGFLSFSLFFKHDKETRGGQAAFCIVNLRVSCEEARVVHRIGQKSSLSPFFLQRQNLFKGNVVSRRFKQGKPPNSTVQDMIGEISRGKACGMAWAFFY